MKQISAILAIILISAIPVTAANVTRVEIHGVVFDESSNKYNTTLLWDAQNFTGFWYASGGGKSSETLKIDQAASSLKTGSRIINEEKLLYNTARTDQKYVAFSEKGKLVENGLEYNGTSKIFTRNTTGGYYARLGWFGDVYVAANGKANKLAKLIKEQKKDEKQTLKLGETWGLGEGYNLTFEAVDTKTSPRQAWLILAKDGKTLEIKVVNEGEVYTYIEKSLSGESSVPLFVTYIDGIFTEDKGTFVQLKYTWLISNNVLEIKTGDKFSVFEVKEATENSLTLYNKDNPINLGQNSMQPLYGDLKFKIADSATALRFYPILEKTTPGKYELRGGAYDESKYKNLVWDAQRFPGFWYALGGGKSSESLIVDQNASTLNNVSRTIEDRKLLYNTYRTDQKYKVFSEKSLKIENGLEYNSTTKTFINSRNGGYYARLGWFGELYVAVNGKANKLAKLIKEQDKQEKQTLKLGTTWNLGEGFNLTVDALDVKTNPRQASLSLTKDGITLDTKVVNEGELYTYSEKDLKGESNVPVFVTYIESIFSGAKDSEIFVQLRYTWLISRNVLEVKAGDRLGVFEVKEANENSVLLYNKDRPLNLGQNAVIDLANGLQFKVADSSTALRFSPYFESVIQDTSKSNLTAASANATATSTISTASADSINASAAVTTTLSASADLTGTVKISPPVIIPDDTAKPSQWNWIFFAIAGLIGTGYLVLRKD